MIKTANNCEECGAPATDGGLGAFTRYVGGHGYCVLIECREQVPCAERRDKREAARLMQPSRAA